MMMLGRWFRSPGFRAALPAAVVGAVLLWSSWPALAAMADRWASDPRYSHGYLVPAFALYLLWVRRGRLGDPEGADLPDGGAAARMPKAGGSVGRGDRSRWWGVALLAAGAAVKLGGAFYYYDWFDAISLPISLAGVAALAGGRAALRWAAPAAAFLVFMIPLPYQAEHALGVPLQAIATWASAYSLETLGLSAIPEGFIIHTEHGRIGVAEACNGLGMLYMFLAFAVGAALLARRPAVDRVLIVLSAAPIALAANVARIVLTGVLHETLGRDAAHAFYHDLAGWLMMPLAVAALLAELSLLGLLLVADERPDGRPAPAPAGLATGDATGSWPGRSPWSEPPGRRPSSPSRR